METPTATPEAEVFEFKNPKTHRTITLPKILKTDAGEVEFQPFLEAIIEKSKTDERNKSRAKMEELELRVKDFDEVQARLSDLESNGLSAAQKAAKESERITKEVERAKAEAERYRKSLHEEKVSNAVLKVLGDTKGLVNINKAATLFNAEARPKLIEKNGEFITVAEYDGQELEISDAYAKWIARDDNKILLQNTLQSGAGSTGGQSQVQGKTIKVEAFLKLPFAEQNKLIAEGVKPVD